jgi:hypothetical protein
VRLSSTASRGVYSSLAYSPFGYVYAYVLDNPLSFVDPLGLDTCYADPDTGEVTCIPTVTTTVTVNGSTGDAEFFFGSGGFWGWGSSGTDGPGSLVFRGHGGGNTSGLGNGTFSAQNNWWYGKQKMCLEAAAKDTISGLVHDWVGLAVAIPSGALFVVLIRSLKGYKPSYGWPTGLSIADLLVGLSSLELSILVFHWIAGQ